jgi:hypothetical protein
MTELTWEQLDALEAERKAKARELVERLARVLSREFSYQEIRFIRGWSNGAIEIEAWEIARTNARR